MKSRLSRRHLLSLAPAIAFVACAPAAPTPTTAPTAAPTVVPTVAAAASPSAVAAAPAKSALRLMPGTPAELDAPAAPAATGGGGAASWTAVIAPYQDVGTTATAAQFPRTIKHARGSTSVAAAPSKVAALDTGEIDAVVQLGLKPVAAADYRASGLPAYLQDATQGAKLLGSVAEPDLEALAGVKPDLILSNKLRHDKIYDRLAAIAPTVFVDRPGVTFKENFVLYAQALGREEQAATVVERYRARAAKLNAALPPQRPSVAIVQIRGNVVRFYQRTNFLGVLLNDLGFPRPAAENVDDFAKDLGEERLGEFANADLIVLAVQDGDKNTFAKGIVEGPIWKGLPAVKAGKVLTVDDQTWIGGIGYGAAFVVLDGIAKHFGVTL